MQMQIHQAQHQTSLTILYSQFILSYGMRRFFNSIKPSERIKGPPVSRGYRFIPPSPWAWSHPVAGIFCSSKPYWSQVRASSSMICVSNTVVHRDRASHSSFGFLLLPSTTIEKRQLRSHPSMHHLILEWVIPFDRMDARAIKLVSISHRLSSKAFKRSYSAK